jgi:hypothetical protein
MALAALSTDAFRARGPGSELASGGALADRPA